MLDLLISKFIKQGGLVSWLWQLQLCSIQWHSTLKNFMVDGCCADLVLHNLFYFLCINHWFVFLLISVYKHFYNIIPSSKWRWTKCVPQCTKINKRRWGVFPDFILQEVYLRTSICPVRFMKKSLIHSQVNSYA